MDISPTLLLYIAGSSLHLSISHVYEGQRGCHHSASVEERTISPRPAWEMDGLILEGLTSLAVAYSRLEENRQSYLSFIL